MRLISNVSEWRNWRIYLSRSSCARVRLSMRDSVGAIGGHDVGGVGLGGPFGTDLVRSLVHERLQRIVKSDHEVGMMNGRLGSRDDGRE